MFNKFICWIMKTYFTRVTAPEIKTQAVVSEIVTDAETLAKVNKVLDGAARV